MYLTWFFLATTFVARCRETKWESFTSTRYELLWLRDNSPAHLGPTF